MRKYLIILSLFYLQISIAQEPHGGGEYKHTASECVSKEMHDAITIEIEKNRKILKAKGILKEPKKTRVSFEWPLQQATGFDYCSYYGISNFVDHDMNYPNMLKDYNCGTRTYDLPSGYNHGGVDIFLWPFEWYMKNNMQVEVIAAAPGVIVAKYDGNTDNNCDFSNPNWNAVFIEHSDGTVAWYGHMKNGSLINKAIGASVVTGEKLGLVASSGSSTGPHLHFEVHDNANNVIDPYTGPCYIGSTLWATPRTYYEPTVNTVYTHFVPPVFNTCPQIETRNIKDTFFPGNDIYYAAYFHDQQTANTATYTITKPDNSVHNTWTHNPPQYYAASYWYWQYTIPSQPMYGKWKFTVSMNGGTCSRDFYVVNPATLSINENSNTILKNVFSPIPANEKIYADNIVNQVVIYDMQGKKINEWKQTQMIDISNIPAGIYILSADNFFQKLIISR